MKRIVKTLGLLIIILLIFPHQGQAVELDNIENIQPLFTNINTFQITFDIAPNGKSSNTVYLNARNADKVQINAYLQQYNSGRWTTIKSWSGSRNSTSYGFNKAFIKASIASKIRTYTNSGKKVKISEAKSRYGTFYGVFAWTNRTIETHKTYNNGTMEKITNLQYKK